MQFRKENHLKPDTRLNAEHRALIQRQIVIWGWGGVGVVVLLGVAIGFAILKFNNPNIASRGEWIPAVLVGGLWLWWLRDTIPQWRRARRDLADGRVETLQGVVRYEMGTGVGMIPILKYRLWVGDARLDVTQAQLFALQSGKEYRVQRAPHSRVFLGATSIEDAPPTSVPSPAPVGRIPEWVEPFTQRELELLALLAEGKSNQEMALTLSLSVNTIKMYTSQLYQKMGVKRRTEAVAQARAWGVLR
jgi:DNA-binding CsgD family transcriptional regulator